MKKIITAIVVSTIALQSHAMTPHLASRIIPQATQVIRNIPSHPLRASTPLHPPLIRTQAMPTQNQTRQFGDLIKCFLIVKNAQNVMIERFGKYDRTLQPGLHLKLPLIENTRQIQWSHVDHVGEHTISRSWKNTPRIDLRETVYEIPRQQVITKDNVAMGINALVYYQINDSYKSVYGVQDLPLAIESLTQTTLRNLVGSLHLDETLTSRDLINEKLRTHLAEATDKWGVHITRVELQEVNPPHEIMAAMQREMSAERNRRATILDAEGEKRSAVLRAEGEKEATVQKAEGQAQAFINIAEAEARGLEAIQAVLAQSTESGEYRLRQKYIDTLPKLVEGKEGKTVVVPYDGANLASLFVTARNLLEQK